MIKKKFILFYSGYVYMAHPIYFSLAPNFKEYKTIYCNTNNPITQKVNEGKINKKEILQHFDYYVEINNPEKNYMSHFSKTITRILKRISSKDFSWIILYWKYRRDILNLLNYLKPKAIISLTDGYFIDLVTIPWCIKHDVPFNILQNARLNRFYNKSSIQERVGYVLWNKLLKLPMYPKPISLYGNEDSRTYLFLWSKLSVANPKRGNTFILGNPALDKVFENFSSERILHKNAVICTEALQFTYRQKEINELNKIYAAAIRSMPDYTFYIKVHPREPTEIYEKIFSPAEYPNAKVVDNVKLSDLYKICDFELSVMSTTLFEAVANGVPVITVNPENQLHFSPYFRDFISIHVKRASEIKKGIEIAISREFWDDFLNKREKFLKLINTDIDGKSGMRIAYEIKKLIKPLPSRPDSLLV